MICPTCPHPEHHDRRCTQADEIPICDCPGWYFTTFDSLIAKVIQDED